MFTKDQLQNQITDGGATYRPEFSDEVGCDWCGDIKHIEEMTTTVETDEYELAYLCIFDCADELVK